MWRTHHPLLHILLLKWRQEYSDHQRKYVFGFLSLNYWIVKCVDRWFRAQLYDNELLLPKKSVSGLKCFRRSLSMQHVLEVGGSADTYTPRRTLVSVPMEKASYLCDCQNPIKQISPLLLHACANSDKECFFLQVKRNPHPDCKCLFIYYPNPRHGREQYERSWWNN